MVSFCSRLEGQKDLGREYGTGESENDCAVDSGIYVGSQ